MMLGANQYEKLVSFYEKVFGKKPDMTEGKWAGWQVGSSFFGVGEHSEIHGKSKEPQRLMFNLQTKDVKEEFERIVKEGATVIKEPYEMGDGWIATLADPDGNFFQLMSPWNHD
jgi:predicted enzyme related to lactoylglutathione lyase